jgi:hypothetical protein
MLTCTTSKPLSWAALPSSAMLFWIAATAGFLHKLGTFCGLFRSWAHGSSTSGSGIHGYELRLQNATIHRGLKLGRNSCRCTAATIVLLANLDHTAIIDSSSFAAFLPLKKAVTITWHQIQKSSSKSKLLSM